MSKLSFSKVANVGSTDLVEGRVYFETSTGLLKVATSTTTADIYGGVRSAAWDEEQKLFTIVNQAGDTITLDLSDVASAESVSNALALKLNIGSSDDASTVQSYHGLKKYIDEQIDTIPSAIIYKGDNTTITQSGSDEVTFSVGEIAQSQVTGLSTTLAEKVNNSVFTTHTSNTDNPHSVTKEQIGLGNVDNTSDINKPISTATQSALDLKQNSTDNNLDTTDKTIVGAINEIFPKATGVGKIDPNSGGTGEIFNDYVNNKAKGGNSHAEGSNTTASGSSSHAEGLNTLAYGYFSHAEGEDTEARGGSSHAEGSNTRAGGSSSHAEGDNTEASNISSHAEGYKTFAAGGSSHAEGSNTRAINSYEHAQGFWNNSHTNAGASRVYNTLHSIGIGTSNSDRKNAQEVSVNGDHYIIGIGNYDGTNPKGTDSPAQTLQEVVNGKQNTLVSGTSIKTINGESLLGSGDITIETGSSEVTWDNVTGKPSFATVATSGSYSDLTGTPNLSDYVEDTSILGEPCVRIKDVEGDTGWVTLEGTNGVTVTVNSSPGITGALDIDNVTVSINPSEVEDQSFATTSKTLTGAINELKEGASGSGNGVYYLNGFGNINLIDYDNLETVKQSIQTAIGGLDNFVQALQDGKQIIDKVTVGSTPTDIPWSGFSYSVGSEEGITAVMIVADNPLTCRFGDELLMNKLVQATTNIAIASNDQYQFMIFPAEFRLETKTVPNVSALLKSYFYDYYVSLGSKITGDYTTMCMPVLTPITINGMAYSWTSDDDIMIITGWSIDSDFTQTIEEYKIDIGASSPGSTSETTYKSCSNVLCINSGESTFWRSQTTGTTSGTLQQNQYDLIKRAIDNGCSIVIDTPHPGYIEHFQSVSSSKGSVEGEYTFCYLDYDTATNNFFIKWFKMKSDLTCQVYTKIL